MLLDIHTHLDSYRGTYLGTALEEIRQMRILSVSNSMDFVSYYKNLEIAKKCPFVIPTFGIHPWNAHLFVDRREEMEMAIEESLFIGEIGLDTHFVKDRSKYEAQRQVFEFFLNEAKKREKLVILHTKGAEDDVLKMLRHYNIQRAVIHWYSGPIDTYGKMVQEGYKFSLGFMVMHSDFIRVIARRIPEDQMLIETDNPGGFQWKAGRPGMPLLVKDVCSEIARLRNQSSLEIEQMCWENFMNMLTSEERSEVIRLTKEGENRNVGARGQKPEDTFQKLDVTGQGLGTGSREVVIANQEAHSQGLEPVEENRDFPADKMKDTEQEK